MQLNTAIGRERFQKRFSFSWKQLQPFRETRANIVRKYVGSHYGQNQMSDRKRIVNMILQMASIYQMQLAANRPRCHVTTEYQELVPFANRFKVNLNRIIEQIDLEGTLQTCVLNALFGLGICKVSLGPAGWIKLDNDVYTDPGTIGASAISLDNWVHDMHAPSLRALSFAGDRYLVDRERFRETQFANRKAQKMVLDHSGGAPWGLDEEPAREAGTSLDQFQGERDTIELWDIWCPYEQKVYTMDSEFLYAPLEVVDYTGNPFGPFKYLSFYDVVDNTMPVSPMSAMIELDMLYNSLIRKLANQAKRQKIVPFYNGANVEDASTVNKAQDGEMVKIDAEKDSIGELKMGGIDQSNYAFSLHIKQLFSEYGGNLQMLGGLGPQSATLGQDQLVANQLSQAMSKMQYRTTRFAADVCREVGWQMWNDQIGMRSSESLAELGLPEIVIPMDWNPDHREGEFEYYDFQVEPYSMRYQSPTERSSALSAMMQEVLQIMQTPSAQQSGMTINVEEFVNVQAELRNLPEARRIVRFGGRPTAEMPQAETNMRKPLNTTRNYVRKNVSAGGTPEARTAATIQSLMKADERGSNL